MPTVLILFGLRFYFYVKDHKPVHIQVESGDGEAKFRIENEILAAVRQIGDELAHLPDMF
jgi:hypothetical protein